MEYKVKYKNSLSTFLDSSYPQSSEVFLLLGNVWYDMWIAVNGADATDAWRTLFLESGKDTGFEKHLSQGKQVFIFRSQESALNWPSRRMFAGGRIIIVKLDDVGGYVTDIHR